MKTYIAHLRSVSLYSQSKYLTEPKLEREQPDAYEERCWHLRMDRDKEGRIFIPAMAFKRSFESGAQYANIKIKGSGKATYTKKIVAGIMINENLVTNKTVNDIIKETFLVPADGKPGSKGPRVIKHFPAISDWEGKLTIYVLDDIITKEILSRVIEEAGKFVGVGRFRPQNGGYYGRYELVSLDEA